MKDQHVIEFIFNFENTKISESNFIFLLDFSPGDKYPNKQYGLYPNSTMVWNTNVNKQIK